MDWKKLVDHLDNRPMSVLLAIALGFGTWAFLNWAAEVKEHKEDLRLIYPVLEKTTELQKEVNELLRQKNAEQWSEKDTVAH